MRNATEIAADSYLVILLVLSVAALTTCGVGNRRIAGMVGIVLCMAGLLQARVKVDLRIMVPMLVFELFSAISSFRVSGEVRAGFASTQLIFPVLYLLMACLDNREVLLLRRLCALWAGGVAAAGILQFVKAAQDGTAWRLRILLGNPNSLGCFLVLGWFVLNANRTEETETGLLQALLRHIEPLILAALALTLSLGSFLSMAVGMLVVLGEKKRTCSWAETALFACRMLSRASIGFGAGILLYFTARRTDIPWFCLFLLVWLLAMTAYWRTFERFLEVFPRWAVAIACCGMLVAAAAVAIRSNASATFIERLEMMRNGLGYILKSPLFGIGPYRWRVLNLTDGDKYFNTWHIHNVFIHMGVEIGLVALAMMILVVIRCFRKKGSNQGGAAAFVFHNLMDTSFFYVGLTSMALLTVGDPQKGGTELHPAVTKTAFAVFLLLFLWNIRR